MSATTGVINSESMSVPMTLQLKKGASYSFNGAYAYSITGKSAPAVSITVTDSQGKVVSTKKSNSLSYVASADGTFTVTMAIMPAKGFSAKFTRYQLNAYQTLSKLPLTSGDKNLDAILAGGSNWWHDAGQVATPSATVIAPNVKQIEGARNTIYYAYLFGSESYLSAADKKGFAVTDQAQKGAIATAFSYLSSLVNVTFVQNSQNADIKFGNNDQSASAGYATYPSTDPSRPSILMLDNSNNPENAGAQLGEKGTYGWQTLIHELGHAMGLKHPRAYNAGGGSTPGPYLPKSLDNRSMSIMSYNNSTASTLVTLLGSSTETSYSLRTSTAASTPSSYQLFDIAALQYLYGANTSKQPSSLTVNDAYSQFETLWAPQGVELNAASTTRSNLFDLRAGGYSSIAMRTEASNLADFKVQLKSQGFNDAKANVAASSVMSMLKANKKDATVYNGKNTMALSYGSQYKKVVGGAAADKFYAGTYSTDVNGGDGEDTLYLQGTVKDWVVDRAAGSATAKAGGAVIKFSNMEAIAYYLATDALIHA
jgi:serralysin